MKKKQICSKEAEKTTFAPHLFRTKAGGFFSARRLRVPTPFNDDVLKLTFCSRRSQVVKLRPCAALCSRYQFHLRRERGVPLERRAEKRRLSDGAVAQEAAQPGSISWTLLLVWFHTNRHISQVSAPAFLSLWSASVCPCGQKRSILKVLKADRKSRTPPTELF